MHNVIPRSKATWGSNIVSDRLPRRAELSSQWRSWVYKSTPVRLWECFGCSLFAGYKNVTHDNVIPRSVATWGSTTIKECHVRHSPPRNDVYCSMLQWASHSHISNLRIAISATSNKFNIYFQISPHTHIFIAKCFVTLYVNQPITYYEKTIITTFCVRGSGG